MTAAIADLLGRLREERGAGGGSGNDPGPTRTRGTTSEAGRRCTPERSGSNGRTLPVPLPAEPVRITGVNLGRWYDPNPTLLFHADDVDPQALDELYAACVAVEEAEDGPRHMQEGYRFARTRERPPLWMLRLPNGKPNYASASEQERYLRESGAFRAPTKACPVISWEEWIVTQGDPRRVPPAGADDDLIHDAQRDDYTPTARLAEAVIDGEPIELDVSSNDNDEGGAVVAKPLNFTKRQLEVVGLIALGCSNDEVGARLGITARTAKAHTDIIRAKLGVEKRRQIPQAYTLATGVNPFTLTQPEQVAA